MARKWTRRQEALWYALTMAKKIDALPVVPRNKYPWHQWADGDTWLIEAGTDYHVSNDAMRRAVHSHAQRLGITAETHLAEGGLAIRFHVPTSPEPKKVKKIGRNSSPAK